MPPEQKGKFSNIKVHKAEGSSDPVQVSVRGLRGDMGKVTIDLSVQQDGDVCVTLFDKEKGAIDFELCTRSGGGKNPELTDAFREFVRNLADMIEEAQES